MHPLLQSIRQRPAMYLGPFPIYDKLVAYVAGYEAACLAASHAIPPLLPGDFHEFVARQLNENSTAVGWRGLIARHAIGVQDWHGFMPKTPAEDQAALHLFFELLNAYDQQPRPAAT